MPAERRLAICADVAPLCAALDSLAQLAQTRREAVEAFLDGLDSPSQLFRFDQDVPPAAGTGDLRIVLEPSESLRDFLLAARTGECDGL